MNGKFCDKECVFGQKSKSTPTTKQQKSNIQTLAGAGN